MRPILVMYEDEHMEFYPSAKEASRAWGCSGQAVLNMLDKCRHTDSKFPLRTSNIAAARGIVSIVDIHNIEDFNKYSSIFVFSNKM